VHSRIASATAIAIALAGLSIAQARAASATPAPIATSAGGANQRAALEGCANTWLFNGVWRMKVLKVDPVTGPPYLGYDATVQFKNGTTKDITMNGTGLAVTGSGISMVDSDGNVLDAHADMTTLLFKSLPPGAGMTVHITFAYPDGTKPGDVKPPAKLLYNLDPKSYPYLHSGVHFTTSNPGFRVDLTCPKT
jgi:hypothetical protein